MSSTKNNVHGGDDTRPIRGGDVRKQMEFHDTRDYLTKLIESGRRDHRPLYLGLVEPNGALTYDIECHALLTYAMYVTRAVRSHYAQPNAYEGEEDCGINFRQLISSVATMYNADIDIMTNYWENVDKQYDIMQVKRIPYKQEIRHMVCAEISKIWLPGMQ